jgi:hypothetical protein
VANIPYILDSRRESDGVSSTSPFTYTSPSFPLVRRTNVAEFVAVLQIRLILLFGFLLSSDLVSGRRSGSETAEGKRYTTRFEIFSSCCV